MRELIKFFAWRIRRDEIGLEAAALAFTSVLALIPALTIVVSIFAMVPAFTPIKEEMMRFASENFLPVFTEAIGGYISEFVSHASAMTLTGSLMLFVVSLMLIRSIDRTLNRIWRGGRRRVAMTFAIYWTMLTVGPLSFGITVWVTTRVIASNLFSSMEMELAMRTFYFILPFLIETAMIFVLYMVMPVVLVKWQDAILGALLVAVAFEISKRIFSTFILNFSDYEAIYGAVAAAPVLMIWIYINWWLILIGAEFTSVLGVVRGGNADRVPKLISSLVNLMSSAKEEDVPVVGERRQADARELDELRERELLRSLEKEDKAATAFAEGKTPLLQRFKLKAKGSDKSEQVGEEVQASKKSIRVHITPTRKNTAESDSSEL